MPYMVLNQGVKKCFQFLPPLNQEILINYHCPDIISYDEDEQEEELSKLQQNEGYLPKDAISSRYSEQYKKQKMNKMTNGITITMLQHSLEDEKEKEDKIKNKRKRRRSNRRNHGLNAKKGTVFLKHEAIERSGNVTFLSSPTENGMIQICSSKNTKDSFPTRISISVLEMKEYDPSANVDVIGHSVTRMETDLESLLFKLKRLENANRMNRMDELQFHGTSTTVYRSVRFWPILHVVVMILTTLYQLYQFRTFFAKRII